MNKQIIHRSSIVPCVAGTLACNHTGVLMLAVDDVNRACATYGNSGGPPRFAESGEFQQNLIEKGTNTSEDVGNVHYGKGLVFWLPPLQSDSWFGFIPSKSLTISFGDSEIEPLSVGNTFVFYLALLYT